MTRKRFSDDAGFGRGVRGNDWYHISEAEEAVFKIDVKRVPLMAAVFLDYTENQQDAFSVEAWQNFACSVSSLTQREAFQWWAKNDAYLLRQGLIAFPDGS